MNAEENNEQNEQQNRQQNNGEKVDKVDNGGGLKNILELALLVAGKPLDIRALRQAAGGRVSAADVRQELAALQTEWQPRALQLTESAGGFQFVSRPEYNDNLRRLNPDRPPRLSRSLLEILAIIAYRQPVTRGDIEQLRGVVVASSQISFLQEQGWVEEVGRRETPGRPVLYATTSELLDDLALKSLDDLPLPAEISEEDLETMDNGNGNNGEAKAEAEENGEQQAAEEEKENGKE